MPGERQEDETMPAGWKSLENRFYRRDIVYSDLAWDLTPDDLSRAMLAAAPCAGPLAIVPDSGWGLSYALSTYTLSGRLVKRFDRLRERTVPPFRAVALGWSRDDLLTIVYNDGGVVRLPAGLHKDRSTFVTVFGQNKDERIYDAAVLETGDAVLRGATGAIYHLSTENKVRLESESIRPPEGMVREVPNGGVAAVPSRHGAHASEETLFLTETGNIALLSSGRVFPMVGERDVSQLCVSPKGQYVAVMESTTGCLFVSTVDLHTEIARVNLVIELAALGVENILSDVVFDAKMPESVAWVGSDAVAVLYKEHLVLVGPNGGVAVLDLEGALSLQGSVVMHSEMDGLRLISPSSIEFIQMVPEPVHTVLCRKQAPGFKLRSCSGPVSGALEKTSTDALRRYRLLRELRESGNLLEASRSCTAAAYLEVDGSEQKRLLKAAAYGQRYAAVFGVEATPKSSPSSNPMRVEAASKNNGDRVKLDTNMIPIAIAILRVLHAAASQEAGVPLTKLQLDSCGLAALAARIARLGNYSLALRLVSFGGLSPCDVLSEWASAAVRANIGEPDEVITALISEKFESVSRSYTGIDIHGSRRGRALPYVMAAEAAYEMGRQKCAEFLLRKETRPAQKVAMYLKMGREAPAIIASVASGDPELVLDALGSVLQNRSIRETAKVLRALPPNVGNRACDLFASHLRQIEDYNSLRLVYLEVGRRREAALVEIFLADRIDNSRERMVALEKTASAIGRGYNRRACQFEMQAVQHAAVVASCAIDLEKRCHLAPEELIRANDGELLARAVLDITDSDRRRDTLAKLRKDLRIPDRRFYWICLSAMAEAGDFKSIHTLANSPGYGRAPPIGFTAFVDTCIKYRMDDEAVKYALRIGDLRDRARALARCGRGREAADIASRLRNNQLLDEIQDLAARHAAQITIPPHKALFGR